jgi:hypothetical protein
MSRPPDPTIAAMAEAIEVAAANLPNKAARFSDPAVKDAARGKFVRGKTSRRKKRSKRRNHNRIRAPPLSDAGAYSIPQFCRAHGGMSEAFYYKLAKAGLGPKTMHIGGRTLISIESARKWTLTPIPPLNRN